MLEVKKTFLSEVYESCEHEGWYYFILKKCDKDKCVISLSRTNEDGYEEDYSIDNKWQEHGECHSLEFDSVEECFGFVNNLLFDKFKCGSTAEFEYGKRSKVGTKKIKGVIGINPNYNSTYPYKVLMDDGGYGIFSEEDIV